jgi:Domain of unknown function (DUF4328)
MADYYPLISRAVAELDSNTAEARHALYERAREALVGRIEDETLLEREGVALDSAIRQVEAGMPATRPMPQDKGVATRFRDPKRLTRALQVLLATLLVLAVALLLSNLAQYQMLQSSFTQAEAVADDTRQRIFAWTYLGTDLITVVVFGCWIYRANGNARALGAAGMEFTPGWSVGWYFIPFACLWKPFQAMREIWKASKNPTHWQAERTDHILGWWWFGWIASNVLGQVDFRLAMAAHDVPSLSVASALGVVDDVSVAFSIAVALILITRLSRMQVARHANGWAAIFT